MDKRYLRREFERLKSDILNELEWLKQEAIYQKENIRKGYYHSLGGAFQNTWKLFYQMGELHKLSEIQELLSTEENQQK